MIDELKLINFKSFRNQPIPLTNLNILTGVNGTGKSTIIQSVLMIMQSEIGSAIECNGSLVELGDYSDLQYENAGDDTLKVEVCAFNEKSIWGFGSDSNVAPTIDSLPVVSDSEKISHYVRLESVYISAERWGPRQNVPLKSYNSNPYWLGKHGEFTIQFLHSLSEGGFRDRDGKLKSKLEESDPRLYDSNTGALMLSNIIAWMGEISPNVNINASVIREAMIGYSSFSFTSGKQYKATNVGFGLSYSLSVVTALVSAKSGSLVLIENPEAHLHPSGQSKLGLLIALSSLAGVQVLTETHSEHVINGARIAIRKGVVPAKLLNVMYVDRDSNENGSEIKFIESNDMGQLSKWPDGFFDQQAKDMKALMTGV